MTNIIGYVKVNLEQYLFMERGKLIFNVAIVEDERDAADELERMINKYSEENTENSFSINKFSDALSFLMEGLSGYDVIFLDIQLPDMSGMKAAWKIREKDEDILIVFVTSMAQYAVESYGVHAYDFILKPLIYGNFYMKFRRVVKALEHRRNDDYITLSTRFEKRRVRILDIVYVEVINHDLYFHLTEGKWRVTGTMGEIEKKLLPYHFVRLNSGYLVNLKYVSALHGEYAVVNGEELHISRSRKQNFLLQFAKYVGGSV